MIDLRSDTFSTPSPAMYDALREAELGDDVYREDPTVRRLEALAAQHTGKEAALLVTSGTQGNLVSLLSHCRRGAEVIVGASTDLYNHEVGGISAVGGLLPRPVDDTAGFLLADSVAEAIRQRDDVHVGPTEAICIENTHQRAGGLPIPARALGRDRRGRSRASASPAHGRGTRLQRRHRARHARLPRRCARRQRHLLPEQGPVMPGGLGDLRQRGIRRSRPAPA